MFKIAIGCSFGTFLKTYCPLLRVHLVLESYVVSPLNTYLLPLLLTMFTIDEDCISLVTKLVCPVSVLPPPVSCPASPASCPVSPVSCPASPV